MAKIEITQDTYLVGIGVSPGISIGEVCLLASRPAIDAAEISPELVDIAHLSGFSDQSHFTRIFKSLVGLSPGKYRNFVQDSQTSFFL